MSNQWQTRIVVTMSSEKSAQQALLALQPQQDVALFDRGHTQWSSDGVLVVAQIECADSSVWRSSVHGAFKSLGLIVQVQHISR